MSKQSRPIRSLAMDALRAKSRDARKRLSRRFIVFVQTQRSHKGVVGYVLYGVSSKSEFLKITQKHMFTLFGIGAPPVKVQDIDATVHEFCGHVANRLDARDVHGSVIASMLRAYQSFILEDKNEARANAVEVIIFDKSGKLLWVSHDGTEGEHAYHPKGKMMVLRGCYDPEIRQQVAGLLQSRLRGKRVSSKVINSVKKELKRITGLKHIACLPIGPTLPHSQ